ncbi:cytochrome c biogenesis CcdA family protein [Methanolacinia paynteri]|uniref:cytochrome c biogenesis CcdA family protein n=1 Tax=Methanolacinia paynteri TaxID=230356 RepID=UPI00064EDFEB|nr:cytochrome c biogenesis CcdA family protein [Methanolacinia paynteri]
MKGTLNSKQTVVFCSIFLLLILVCPAYAGYGSTNGNSAVNFSAENTAHDFSYSNTTVYIFYSTHCSGCLKALPVIEETAGNHPNISVSYYNIELSDENLTALYDFAEHHNITFPSYPAIYTGDTIVIEGFDAINSNIEDIFKSVENRSIPDAEYEKRWYTEPVEHSHPGSYSEHPELKLNPYLVLTAGLLDGINPCAFAVLVFLLVSLMAAGSKKKILAIGFSYISAVFIFYILAGLGIMSIVSFTGSSLVFSIIAGVVAVTAGILSINEGIAEDTPVKLRIPVSSKEFIGNIIKKASVPAAFLLGVLVGVFELPCTGGIYLAVLSLLSSEMTFREGMPYLVLYNLMFVLPLVVIVALVYSGLSPAAVDEFREKHRREMKVILGIILAFIGFYVIFLTFV